MNNKNRKSLMKILLAVIFLFSNAAFKKGDTIQLGKNLNGRRNLNFYKNADNIEHVVKAGTIASVMDYRRLKSGNYGVQVRLEGLEYKNLPEAKRLVWLYDWKDRNDDLKACADSACIEKAQSMEQAGWTQALRDQASTKEAPEEIVQEVKTENKKPLVATQEEKPLVVEEKLTAAEGCGNWGCSRADSSAPSAQIQNISETLPTAPDDYDEEPAPEEDAEAPSSDAVLGAAEGLNFTGGALLPKACHKIIDNQGNIGPYGEMLVRSMMRDKYNISMQERDPSTGRVNSVNKSVFLRNDVMGPLCSGYGKMSDPQKLTALLFMFAALANKEGSCSTVNDHKALVRAYGLFSAEYYQADRNKRGRGADCRGDIKNVGVQISCAVDTTAAFGSQGLLDGKRFTQSGYFEPLQDWNKRGVWSKKRKKYLPYTPIVDYVKRIAQCK